MIQLEILPDIPRYLTAIAEWSAIFAYSFIFLRKLDLSWTLKAALLAAGQILLQLFAGILPYPLWIPGMLINILWMYLSLNLLTNTNILTRLFVLAKAFILSELLASVGWLIYCVTVYRLSVDNSLMEGSFNILMYLLILVVIYTIEVQADFSSYFSSFTKNDILIALLMGAITFTISNIGFLLSTTIFNLGNSLAVFSLRMFVNVSGLCLLYIQQYVKVDSYRKREIDNMNNLFNNQYQQYKTYAESTDFINRKAHDLKHQINVIILEPDALKRESYLSSLSESIENLNAKVDTGNAVLDTILTQKNQYCISNQINFTCMAEGSLLADMDIMDLTSLFGNAIDNAIEHVQKIKEKDKRLITLKLTSKGKMAVLRVDNYCIDELDMVDDLPRTSKRDKENHGYGLKSIQYIAKKYNGNTTVNLEDSWFTLSVVFPIIK